MTQQDALDLARIFRAESGRILASLLMLTRDFDLAEDALQDALVQANSEWSTRGKPNNPAAWLLTVAKRRLIDRIRKESLRRSDDICQAILDTLPESSEVACEEDESIPDERLRLVFTCSHPALAENVRVPLTLKTVCGLSVREIARAYLCSETSMLQRLTRAKRKIRDAGIAYEVPEGDRLSERLPTVLSVIYLLYNESYSAYEGQSLSRCELAEEAIRLARLVASLLPQPECSGLLALLLLHESRRLARSNDEQNFIPLQHQDRGLWNKALINEGVQLALSTLAQSRPGPYQIQAAISALHSLAKTWDSTDWHQIILLYETLHRLQPSPVVRLNQALAIAYSGNEESALEQVNALEADLRNYQPFYVARCEIYEKLRNRKAALINLDIALGLTKNQIEYDYLSQRRKTIES